jgi:hypothetical protein
LSAKTHHRGTESPEDAQRLSNHAFSVRLYALPESDSESVTAKASLPASLPASQSVSLPASQSASLPVSLPVSLQVPLSVSLPEPLSASLPALL